MTTVLLIDDSKLMRAANQHTLVKAGYRVITAEDGVEGVQLARDSHPDVVILDLMLPKLGGLEVLHTLKGDPGVAEIPVLVLTGLSQLNEVKLRAEGAAAFLEKTRLLDDEQRLIEVVEHLVQEGEILKTRRQIPQFR
jgi:CheY-like chemotaxis protein